MDKKPLYRYKRLFKDYYLNNIKKLDVSTKLIDNFLHFQYKFVSFSENIKHTNYLKKQKKLHSANNIIDIKFRILN